MAIADWYRIERQVATADRPTLARWLKALLDDRLARSALLARLRQRMKQAGDYPMGSGAPRTAQKPSHPPARSSRPDGSLRSMVQVLIRIDPPGTTRNARPSFERSAGRAAPASCEHLVNGRALHLAASDVPRQLRISVPPRPLLDCFDAIARSAYRTIAAHGAQSHTLAELRDALLPKLISGELRMEDAERFLERVT